MTDDLVLWLRAQLDEDEAEARRGYLKAEPLPDYDGWDKGTTAGLPPAVAARVLREIDADREMLAEYERLLRAHAAHKAEAARMAQAGDDDPFQGAALRREADYLPAMVHVLERWAKRKAAVFADRPGFQESWRP